MPGKPSRKDRRRSGGLRNAPVRRPRPAPAVSPHRIARRESEEASREIEADQIAKEEEAVAATVAPSRPSPRMTQRRSMTSSARAAETQRVERLRREAMHDLRYIGITAGITLIVFVVAIVVF